ncbi:hypothetical protein PL321_18440 [Caloramator sp. mosi_1]|nr:glycosyltransferase [Caloramator sp. mosi_1]WDC85909.1 hypothetical protein PL321_18440 [Caloramator sp. mosi_1]
MDNPNKSYVKFCLNLYKIFKNSNYNVVHSHTLLNSGLVVLIAKIAGIKNRISHSHSTNNGIKDSDRKESIIYYFYEKIMRYLIIKYSTAYIACGKKAGYYLYGKKIFDKKDLFLKMV